jgi:hypothetical protein
MHICQPHALALTGVRLTDMADVICESAMAFNQVLDMLYPMAWETPR